MDEREGYLKWKVEDKKNRSRIDYYQLKKNCQSQIHKKEKTIIPQMFKAD